MGERSASDREGVGSTPTSGPHTANPGYAAFQLAKALTTAEEHGDPATRERAYQKAEKWASVFEQLIGGSLQAGSRTPIDSVPAWATLEVLTGGFASGKLLAGGPLQDHERALATRRGVVIDGDNRLGLNRYFLSEEGLAVLREQMNRGTFEVGVPEEGALLVMAWLLDNGYSEKARVLLDELTPFLSWLRFYAEPTEQPRRYGTKVFLQNVDATVKRLRDIRPNKRIAAQKEAIQVWAALYDELVELFLETVEGEPPSLAAGPDGVPFPRENGKYQVEGGWPCRRFPSDWQRRTTDFLRRFEHERQKHTQSSKPRHQKSSLAQLVEYLPRCVSDASSLSGRDVGRIRLLLARYVAKRGLPGSAKCRAVRDRQAVQARTPMYHLVAAAVIPRLAVYPGKEGIEDLAPVMQPITQNELAICGLEAEHELPESIRRKIERCLSGTVEVLVSCGLVTSGDTLAELLPQVSSQLRAAGITDPTLRQIYAAIYQAFRRRRSLLLFDLQSQVQIHELPWVAAIDEFRSENLSSQEAANQALHEVICLALVSFPQAIIPNKLLQELRALQKSAGINIPLIDELAADIFMGEFSSKFVHAAQQAAAVMRGTLYETYYGIEYEAVLRLPATLEKPPQSWFSGRSRNQTEGLIQLCCSRAGVPTGTWNPAANGMIIEQQQILTTQNLATLISGLGLVDALRPQLLDMSRRCFEWVCRRQQMKVTDWHARLLMIKNTAYAWRQMLIYLSFVSPTDQVSYIEWTRSHFLAQRDDFQRRFRPAFDGLTLALNGTTPARHDARDVGPRQFLGWSKSRHWLLD